MSKPHEVQLWGRTADGSDVAVYFPTLANLVKCIVPADGQTVKEMLLDELLAEYADEINGNTEALKSKVDKESGKGLSANDFTAALKKKLDEIADNANNYTHPVNHPPDIILQDAENMFVTDAEKSAWNAKAGTSAATTAANGLMSAADKTKLDGIDTDAQKNTVTSVFGQTGDVTGSKSDVGLGNVDNTSDANKPVSTAQQNALNDKVDKVGGKQLSEKDFTATLLEKLNNIADNANNYEHPTSAGNKHIPSGGADGQILRYSADGTAAWGADNDTVYTHPVTSGNKHIPTGGASGQILRWSESGTAVWGADNNTTYSAATASAAGLMSAADKTKLNGIATGANNGIVNNTTVSSSFGIGGGALAANTGAHNTAVGNNALNGNTTGAMNTAVGRYALNGNTTGNFNTTVGHYALYHNVTGAGNTAVGDRAGAYLSNNLASQITSTNSIFIGVTSTGSANDNQTNQIVIGYSASGGGSNTVTLGNSQITQLRCQVTAITALSDSRTKEYAEPADLDLCVEAVKKLTVSRYKYEKFTGKHLDENVTGFLADDVEKVFPKSVTKNDRYFPVLDENGEQVYEEITEIVLEKDEDGNEIEVEKIRQIEKMFLMEDVKEITMTEAVPTLWGAVQKLIKKIETLEEKIA